MKPAVTTPRDALDRPCRTKGAAALDIATAALTHARRVIVSAVRANAPLADPDQHSAVVEIDRALDKIKTLVPEKSQ